MPVERLLFLDPPVYETRAVREKLPGEEDVRITVELLLTLEPHETYAADDLYNPHGTHRVCLAAVFKAFEKSKNKVWVKQCQVWLHRGAWQEWRPE